MRSQRLNHFAGDHPHRRAARGLGLRRGCSLGGSIGHRIIIIIIIRERRQVGIAEFGGQRGRLLRSGAGCGIGIDLLEGAVGARGDQLCGLGGIV